LYLCKCNYVIITQLCQKKLIMQINRQIFSFLFTHIIYFNDRTLLLYILYVRHKCFKICMYASSYFGSKLSLKKKQKQHNQNPWVGTTPWIKHRVDDRSTGVINAARTATLPEHIASPPWCLCCSIFIIFCIFCQPCLFFGHCIVLYCLSCELRLQITPLVSSN
jgi:hypothetical protein